MDPNEQTTERDELTKLKDEHEDLQAVFDLRWDADMRAIKRWQAAHPGNDLRWPDHADLVVWLMEQLSWQPIETAPKDGTKVDLWFPHTGREIDWEWADEDPFDPPQWIHRGKENVTTYPNQTPTHWRHVPVMPHDPAPR